MAELTVPEGWKRATPKQMQHAVGAALQALSDDGPYGVSARLESFYKIDGNFAGATFTELQPTEPRNITVSDLHAVTMLSVSVEPRATRRLLNDGGYRCDVLTELASLDDLGVTHLQDAGPSVLDAMDRFFRAVRRACEDPTAAKSNPWVTASKICARKRPGLFPVRDALVCTALGLIGAGLPHGDWQVDWQVYAHLLDHQDVAPRLDEVQKHVESLGRDEYGHDQYRLRTLDAALWTLASSRAREARKRRRDASRLGSKRRVGPGNNGTG